MFLQSLPRIFQYAIEFFVIVWLLAAIANKTKRGALKDKLSTIMSLPPVYTQMDKDANIALYPRSNLERAAQAWKTWFVTPVEKVFNRVDDWFKNLRTGIIPKMKDAGDDEQPRENPWKVFNYFLLLLLFVGYLYADAITVANTLEGFGLVHNLEDALKRYDIAILFGSLISVVLGGIIANDIFGDGDFTDWNIKRDSKWGWFGKIFSIFLILSGLYVIASLGAARYGRLVAVPEDVLSFLQDNGQIVINILTPINAALATALIADDAFNKGLKILGLIALVFLLGILAIIWYFVGAIYGTVVYLIDVLWRLVLGASGVAAFFMLTPLDDAIEKIQSRSK